MNKNEENYTIPTIIFVAFLVFAVFSSLNNTRPMVWGDEVIIPPGALVCDENSCIQY